MKILFKNHFQPMLECCELLEDCLRKERYEETLRGEHLPIEEEKRIQSHIDVLTDIRSEVDAVFLQDYKDLSLLFEDKKNGKVTLFAAFSSVIWIWRNRLGCSCRGCAGSARKTASV